MKLILTVGIVFVLLCLNEYWWRNRHAHLEINRKFIHITVGSFVAFWPFYLSWQDIRMLSLAFLVVVLFSKYFGIFKSIHSVRRPTWGEIFFAIAVGATTYVTQNKWIFMAAILQMALADGLAAVVGVQYGRGQRYLVFGHTKSLVGSTTFMLISGMILASFAIVSATPLSFAVIFGLSVAAGIIENLGVLGLDNLFVPLLIAAVLEQIVH